MIKIRTQQILLPKQVYIGDHAELRVSFSIDSQLIKNGINTMMQNGITELSLNNFESEVNSYEYEIKSIKLVSSSTGDICSCNFVIEFIPWRTGFIQLPDYNITKALTSSKEEYIPSDTDLAIHFEPLQIVSLIANNSSVALKGQASPLLLPGTIYWIYACAIAIVLILVTLINLIVKHKKLALFIKNKKLERRYKKNRRQTEKQLILLKEGSDSDHEFAQTVQTTMRNYLEIRFDAAFTKATTSEFTPLFYERTQGLLSEQKEDAFLNIVEVFIRTDFIRYSKDSVLEKGEKASLIQKLIDAINVIESVEVEAENV